MKQVYLTTTLADAEIIRVILRKYGILSMLEGAGVGIRGPATPLIVSVQDADAKRAIEVIKKERHPRKAATKKRPRKAAKKKPKKKAAKKAKKKVAKRKRR